MIGIKDMEMPKDCDDCHIKDLGDGMCDVWCALELRMISDEKGKRPDWCPLVEIKLDASIS